MLEEDVTAKEFWEEKILLWENARYSRWGSLLPTSWSVMSRLNLAAKVILERSNIHGSILELACGSGHLARKIVGACSSYHGIDIASNAIDEANAKIQIPGFTFAAADVLEVPFAPADLVVFLGLTDWLDEEELHELFKKLTAKDLLFSYTEAGSLNPYRAYRKLMDSPSEDSASHAKMYSTKFIVELCQTYGYEAEVLSKPSLTNPGGLVWASRRR